MKLGRYALLATGLLVTPVSAQSANPDLKDRSAQADAAPVPTLEGKEFLILKGTKYTVPGGSIVCSEPSKFGDYASVDFGSQSGFTYKKDSQMVAGAKNPPEGTQGSIDDRIEANVKTGIGWHYNLIARTKSPLTKDELPQLNELVETSLRACDMARAGTLPGAREAEKTTIIVPFMEPSAPRKDMSGQRPTSHEL